MVVQLAANATLSHAIASSGEEMESFLAAMVLISPIVTIPLTLAAAALWTLVLRGSLCFLGTELTVVVVGKAIALSFAGFALQPLTMLAWLALNPRGAAGYILGTSDGGYWVTPMAIGSLAVGLGLLVWGLSRRGCPVIDALVAGLASAALLSSGLVLIDRFISTL